MYNKIGLILIAAFSILFSSKGYSQDPERRALLKVSMDYMDAMYQAAPEKMEKCLGDSFLKNGFYWKGSQESYSDMTSLNRSQMIQIAMDWNKEKWVPEDAPRKLDILDLQEKIAVVRLTAFWGVEYLQLVKTKEGWRIVQVLSQNWPKKIAGKDQTP